MTANQFAQDFDGESDMHTSGRLYTPGRVVSPLWNIRAKEFDLGYNYASGLNPLHAVIDMAS